ncbi:MAG TPA: hypothetical protein VLL52_03475 [Anaerolineae bacterium]|nr:hypothetical protein [Anaerolineae bacterium]
MRKNTLIFILSTMLMALLLTACGGEATPEPTTEPTAEPTMEPTAEPTATAEMVNSNAVTVEDQAVSAEGTVTIASVTADQDGWIVIHTQADGAPGPVAGFAPVSAGDNTDVVVDIDTDLATETLYAMLHVDAGTAGEYEFPGDDGPARDGEGNVVTPSFMVTMANSNAVTVEDQAVSAEGTVTIASVTADQDGWIVIHTQADGAPGPVAGFAPISAGDNTDVVVDIDTDLATETLYAMLHVDAGTAGEYEFPGDDGPARDGEGNVVTPSFMTTMGNSNAVTVEDQVVSAEGTVTIASVTATQDGWIVIHTQADGAPGPVAGFAPISAGNNIDVVVDIDTDLATETLYAMLHVDAGTTGEYEFPGEDGPARDAEGNVVTPSFMLLTNSNAVTVEDQAVSAEGTITIASVTADQDGWIVIHTQADGAPGPVAGFAAVSAGDNTNVVVDIDTDLATETLYAMLHVDAGTAGEYEFPGEDGPARDAEGNVVTPSFAVTFP